MIGRDDVCIAAGGSTGALVAREGSGLPRAAKSFRVRPLRILRIVRFGLRFDALSLVMMLVITVVGFLIHLYSTAYMDGDDGYSRFFAYMNLFMGSMLVLVLADNLLLLYLGWEGVGLCSYLLIGFWYRDPENGMRRARPSSSRGRATRRC